MQMQIGVILRCFAKKPELVKQQTEEVLGAVDRVRKALRHRDVLERIDIWIPENDTFIDSDCGQTAAHIRNFHSAVFTTRMDLFSGLINEAAAVQLARGCSHSFVLSSSCASLISTENMEAMLAPFENGAKATGLILPDPSLGEFIRKGCITNTFAVWDLLDFFTVGGMDLSLRNRYKDERLNEYVRGPEGPIPITGLEIPTVARLIEAHGKCIAPVSPITGGEWLRPNQGIDPEGFAREERKMKSKADRHYAIAARYGFSLSYIESGVMPGYPK